MVVSRKGIVATEHPLASRAGARVLDEGGHAVDAAIAANAVMGVVCPMMCGVGGDLFAIVCEPDGKMYGVNGSGWAPAGLTPQALERQGFHGMPQSGVHSITVPGAVGGWSLLIERFGRIPLAKVLDSAIALADEGFPVAEITSEEWHNQAEFLRGDPGAEKTFLPERRPLDLGEVFRNPDLAWTYRQIAAGGRDGFYEGEVARRIVDGLERRGSAMAAADFSEFKARWADPIATSYRGWDVFELPPNGAGIAALLMLNILEGSPLGENGHNSVDALHALIEAKKLAYADMLQYVADPSFADVPVEAMLDKAYARARASLIDASNAQSRVTAGAFLQAPSGVLDKRGGRYDVSGSRRSLWQHGVAHTEQLREFRIGRRRGGHRLRAAESRRAVHARSRAPERARAPQAAAPHHHPRLHVFSRGPPAPLGAARWRGPFTPRRSRL